MRKFVIVMAAAAGLGLMASSGASAAPVGAFAINAAADAVGSVVDVRGCGYGRCGGWHCPRVKCWKLVCRKVYRTKKCC